MHQGLLVIALRGNATGEPSTECNDRWLHCLAHTGRGGVEWGGGGANIRREEGAGAAIGQVWTCHCRSSRACPTAFIALSVHHMFVRPVALLVFQTIPDPCLPGWGQSCGPQVLGFTAWGHRTRDTESGSWRVCGVPCLGVRYHGRACLRWPLLAAHPWLRGSPGH